MSAIVLGPLATAAATVAAQKGLEAGKSFLSTVGKAALSGNPIKSLADLAKPTRVEPLVLVDKDLRDQPYIEDIMKVALSTFTGYYMQAATNLININRIETLRVLDSLNPQRSGVFGDLRSKAAGTVFSSETYQEGLPSLESFDQPLDPKVIVSMEKGPSASVSDDSLKRLYEIENLAVGKTLNIEFKEGNETHKVPVMIRLVPTAVPSQLLTHIFTATSKNSSWKERYHLWRAGQIRFVRDLMFSIDIIDEHRKALINDTSNVYMTITNRRRSNSVKAIASGTPSMADASNIAVISKDTAKQVERELYGKLDSLNTRKKIFDASYLILLIVVDEEWERVTIYHRGLDQPTELKFKEIRNSEKGKGPDITDILKAYSLGASPTI